MKKKEIKNKIEKVEGKLSKHPKGFGFVEPNEEGLNPQIEKQDIFVGAKNMGDAMSGDIVLVEIIPEKVWRKNREGKIVSVLSHNTKEVIGHFQKEKGFGFVVPSSTENEDIFIGKTNSSGAKDGDLVLTEILKYPKDGKSAEGKIKEIIARKGDVGIDIVALIREKGLREEFPSDVLAEASFVSKKPIKVNNRRDLRDKLIFTIDGDDSKDFDDAVSLEINEKGNYLLGVHIADVTHYVKDESYLDKEAFKRGNSVYLLDRVIPMLPKKLSNGICSLNPNCDRLTLSINMEIDKNFKIVSYDIYKSIIDSKYRLTYREVSDFVENGIENEKLKFDTPLGDVIVKMNAVAKGFAFKRNERGSIDFDLDEPSIKLNDEGIPVEIKIAERRSANKLIEEFMLLANKTIAEHFFFLKVPFVFRVHEKPELSKLEELKMFLKGLDISIPENLNNIHPKTISDVLSKAQGGPYEDIVNNVVLRSMQKATYETTCNGHFGLSYRYYCHFTSPIRRYADLMVHRIIKSNIKGENLKKFKDKAELAAINSSKTERLAIDLEREVEKLKKAEYMTYHIGEKYMGIVSGITSFGIYVELENTVEGMVRLDEIAFDYFEYEESKKTLIGRNTGKKYSLGDKVKIKVIDADISKRQIDFALI